MAMNILLWIVVGLATGSIARKLMPGPAAGGISIAILIGVVGAIVGGIVGTIFQTTHGALLTFLPYLRRSTERRIHFSFIAASRFDRVVHFGCLRIDEPAVAGASIGSSVVRPQ